MKLAKSEKVLKNYRFKLEFKINFLFNFHAKQRRLKC